MRVNFTDDAGDEESVTSTATATMAERPNTPATGSPTINGTPQVGETLTGDVSGIADADGLTNVSYEYEWLTGAGSSVTKIAGATASIYLLSASDEGATIQVRVSFTDDAGYEEELTSTETAAVTFAIEQQVANTRATGSLTVSGTARFGERR